MMKGFRFHVFCPYKTLRTESLGVFFLPLGSEPKWAQGLRV